MDQKQWEHPELWRLRSGKQHPLVAMCDCFVAHECHIHVAIKREREREDA